MKVIPIAESGGAVQVFREYMDLARLRLELLVKVMHLTEFTAFATTTFMQEFQVIITAPDLEFGVVLPAGLEYRDLLNQALGLKV